MLFKFPFRKGDSGGFFRVFVQAIINITFALSKGAARQVKEEKGIFR